MAVGFLDNMSVSGMIWLGSGLDRLRMAESLINILLRYKMSLSYRSLLRHEIYIFTNQNLMIKLFLSHLNLIDISQDMNKYFSKLCKILFKYL